MKLKAFSINRFTTFFLGTLGCSSTAIWDLHLRSAKPSAAGDPTSNWGNGYSSFSSTIMALGTFPMKTLPIEQYEVPCTKIYFAANNSCFPLRPTFGFR